MTNTTALDLFKDAGDVDISDLGNSSSGYKPPKGDTLVVQPTLVRQGETKAGLPSWGVQLYVVGGDDDGKSFWTNFNLVLDYEELNAATREYLRVFGLDTDTMLSSINGELTDSQLVSIVLANGPVNIRAGYKKDRKDPSKLWDDHHFTTVDDSVVSTDDEESDSNFRY